MSSYLWSALSWFNPFGGPSIPKSSLSQVKADHLCQSNILSKIAAKRTVPYEPRESVGTFVATAEMPFPPVSIYTDISAPSQLVFSASDLLDAKQGLKSTFKPPRATTSSEIFAKQFLDAAERIQQKQDE